MKAKLIFTMPEDEDEFYYAKNGYGYYFVLDDLLQHIRTYLKHGGDDEHPTKSKIKGEVYEEIRSMIIENLNDRGLKI